ncbi:MAG: NOG1 family protein [Candidatus Hydrothermarchaeales archaeon]
MDLKGIPPVYSPEKLVDIAFRRASKEARKVQVKNRNLRRKRAEERRVRETGLYITSYLAGLERLKERIEGAPLFYRELLEITAGTERITKALDSLTWARKRVTKLQDRSRRDIRMSKDDAVVLRKAFYGKTSSILKKLKPEFKLLGGVCETIKNFPTIKEGFTVVIAGMPNVGKSSLLRQLTSSKPEVKVYPFTTKNILVGYMEIGHRRVQIIDTPGLLDRPIDERNPIEKQAILALQHLADIILFLFDPTATCGFPLESQLELYGEIRKSFKEVVPVINKVDIADQVIMKKLEEGIGKKPLKCAAASEQVEEVRRFIQSSRGKESIRDPLSESSYPRV